MSEYQEHTPDTLLERFLDEQLSESDSEEFKRRMQDNNELRARVMQDRELVDRMQANFQPVVPSLETIEQQLIASEFSQPAAHLGKSSRPLGRASSRRYLIWGACLSCIAGLLAWMLVTQPFRGGDKMVPYFQQRPLARLYTESVSQGFRPYYYCEDQERFARTFLKRQDTPLVLAELPDDRRMVGLSYPGGLSRNTTAMLAYVEERPVIVFVDRRSVDNEEIATALANEDELFVHRTVLGNLVLYEVTPLDEPKMTQYLRLTDSLERLDN